MTANTNAGQKLLVISSFPAKGKIHGEGTVGIASYTKNTLLYILKAANSKGQDLEITVLAEKLGENDEAEYAEDGMLIKRVWQRGKTGSFITLLSQCLKSDTEKIMVEFEVSMFGSPLNLIFFPLLILILKLYGKKVYFVPHQIITDISDLSGHINISKKSLFTGILNFLIRLFFRQSIASAYRTIVFEEFFKNLFGKKLREKITVIPHGVEKNNPLLSYKEAREKLGIKDEIVLLSFGFIAWYKGTDWLLDGIQDKRLKLIIAGGANPNHKDKVFYQEYVKSIEKKAKNSGGRISVTEFVEEDKIALYFQAADAVILPYRTFMSSSGPLAIAFTFEKPVLLSDRLKNYMLTDDFRTAMQEADISDNELFFPLNGSLVKEIKSSAENGLMEKLREFSRIMKEKRDFRLIGAKYYQFIFTNDVQS